MVLSSRKTALSGVGVLCAAIGNAISQYVQGGPQAIDYGVLLTGVVTGIGLLLAKDHDVTGGTRVQPSPPAVTAAQTAEIKTNLEAPK